MSDVYFDGEEEALLTVVNACVILAPMTVENAASAVFLLAILATEGGNVEGLERLLKEYLGEERYTEAFESMTEAVKQYVNNRTIEIPEGG